MAEFLTGTIAKRLWNIKDNDDNPLIGTLMKMADEALGYYISAGQHAALPETVGQELITMQIRLRAIKKMAISEKNLTLHMNPRADIPFLIESIIRDILPSLDQSRKLRLTDGETNTALVQFPEQLIPGVNPKELAEKICASGKSWEFVQALKKKGITSSTLDLIREANPQTNSPWELACDAKLLKLIDDAELTRDIQLPGALAGGGGTKTIKHMPCMMTRDILEDDGFSSNAEELNLQEMKKGFENLAESFEILATSPDALVERAKQAARKAWEGKWEEIIQKIDLDNVMAGHKVKDPANLALQLRAAVAMIDHGIKELAKPPVKRLLS